MPALDLGENHFLFPQGDLHNGIIRHDQVVLQPSFYMIQVDQETAAYTEKIVSVTENFRNLRECSSKSIRIGTCVQNYRVLLPGFKKRISV